MNENSVLGVFFPGFRLSKFGLKLEAIAVQHRRELRGLNAVVFGDRVGERFQETTLFDTRKVAAWCDHRELPTIVALSGKYPG